MGAAAAPYEPYHPHLAYTLALTGLAWLLIRCYSRSALREAPRARAVLYGTAIMLPLLAELCSYLVYLLRPAVSTPLGALLSSIHLSYLQPLQIDSFLPPALLAGALLALGALLLFSTVRLALGGLQLARLVRYADALDEAGFPELQRRIGALAGASGLALPPIGVLPLDAPVAFTGGLLRPRIYIAHFLLELLSEDEAVAVLCHELAHASRGDNAWNWLVSLFRDMGWFLPLNHIGWRWMVVSQDEACDALAVRITRDHLAMARALLKVAGAWHDDRRLVPVGANAFASGPSVAVRVEQLLALHQAEAPARRGHFLGATCLAALLILLGALPALLGS